MATLSIDTIAGIATPPGIGGIGIIRISGPNVRHIADQMLGSVPAPRQAEFPLSENQRRKEKRLTMASPCFSPLPAPSPGRTS